MKKLPPLKRLGACLTSLSLAGLALLTADSRRSKQAAPIKSINPIKMK